MAWMVGFAGIGRPCASLCGAALSNDGWLQEFSLCLELRAGQQGIAVRGVSRTAIAEVEHNGFLCECF